MSDTMHRRQDGEHPGPVREAVFQLDWTDIEAIGWGELLTHCRDAGLRDIEMLEGDCWHSICELVVESALDHRVLDDLAYVTQWEFLSRTDGTCRYLLELTAPDLPDLITESQDKLIGTCDPTLTDCGLEMSIRGPQEPIREVIRTLETVGVRPNLRKIGSYRGETSILDSLTDRQLEVIETAYDLGFYEVPRQATTEDVADELEVEATTVSNHLQRGERNLLRQTLTRP